MKSKAEVIKAELTGLRVLNVGGCGFGADNVYGQQLRNAWSTVASRTFETWPLSAQRIDFVGGARPLLSRLAS